MAPDLQRIENPHDKWVLGKRKEKEALPNESLVLNLLN